MKRLGVPRLLGGILGLSVEAAIMAALLVMAGICALGSIIGWLIGKAKPKALSKRRAPTTAAFPQRPSTHRKSSV